MAFNKTKLCLIAHGSGNQIFHYVSDDDATAIESAGYFNDAVDAVNMRKGDVIIASSDMDGTPALKLYMASSVESGVVSVVAAQ